MAVGGGAPVDASCVVPESLYGLGLDSSGEDVFPAILYPDGEEVYVLTHDGLYRHALYADTMELVLDSGQYGSIGETGRDFRGMAVIEADGKDSFLILYSDGTLMRYRFDTELTSEPDLRVYSVYEDINVTRAVNAYREAHPEQTVIYETGSKSNYGVTLMDLLNHLSTEIAAGTGPDILVMDAIPFRSYAEKGVLMDLSFLRDAMDRETYYTNVVDGFETEGGLFAMPMAFVVPVAGAGPEWMGRLSEARSLSDYADLLEEARREIPRGELTGFFNAEHTLSQLSQASMGAWMDEEGRGIDRAAIAEFLAAAKRIYDVTVKGAPQGMENWYPDWEPEYLDPNRITRIFREDLKRPLKLLRGDPDSRQWYDTPVPFYADYLRENYADINGYLEYYGGDLTLLPGQAYGSCLPVTVLAVNQGTKHAQESREFMEFIFSGKTQADLELFGFPVSREACRAKQADTRPEGKRGAVGSIWFDRAGNDRYDYYWPSEEAFRRLDALLERVTGVGMCDSQVYDTVIRLGQAVLKGENSIEEAVEAIEKELQIYLAE